MNVLIIEDDDDKAKKLEEFVHAEYSDSTVKRVKSFSTGLRSLSEDRDRLDIVLLDMSMPSFDVSQQEPSGGTPIAFAGKELLVQMRLRGIEVPTIVVTMFNSFTEGAKRASLNQLIEELETELHPPYMGCVYFDSTQEGWMTALKKLVDENARGVR